MTSEKQPTFVPHAIILTEFSIPRPIIAAALINAERYKRIDFDLKKHPLTYVEQALKKLPLGVPCFGFTTGFIINYSPQKTVEFDKNGFPIATLKNMKTLGQATIRV